MAETGNGDGRLIFIGGSPRSGTTLVQNMLDCHPLIVGGPEFLHLPDMIDLRRKLHDSIGREWISIICSRAEVDDFLVTFVTNLFLKLADKHASQFYSEKTPGNILVFSELLELFPHAHFIQVVRDPRAILASMQQVKQRAIAKGLKPPWFTRDIATSMAYIKRCVDAGHQAQRVAPERILTISYERLVAEPEQEARQMCRHLGIAWDASMLRPGEQQHLGDKAITTKSNEIWYDPKTYQQNVTAKALKKWRIDLSPYQQVYTSMAFSGDPHMKAHGYDFSMAGLAKDRPLLSRLILYTCYGAIRLMRWVRRGWRKVWGK